MVKTYKIVSDGEDNECDYEGMLLLEVQHFLLPALRVVRQAEQQPLKSKNDCYL